LDEDSKTEKNTQSNTGKDLAAWTAAGFWLSAAVQGWAELLWSYQMSGLP